MINHNAIFREELKKIVSAMNKKHTVLRKQIIKTAEVFQNDHLPVFPYEVVFGLFRQISQTASLTTSLIFFPFLQNIINLGFANQEMSRQIITLLTHIKSIPKFQSSQNGYKLQTIILLLVSKNAINLDNMSYTHSIINVLFSLQNSKHKNIWMKSFSILSQICLLFLNQLKQDQKKQKALIFNNFLKDIFIIVRGQQPKWLIQHPQAYIMLALISQIIEEKYFKENIQEHKQLFEHCILFLRKQIQKINNTSCIHKQPSSPLKTQKTWELSVQNKLIILMRACCKMSKLCLNFFQILQEIVKIITQKGYTSIKFIGYESINYLFNSTQWMEKMLISSSGDLFNFLLTTLFNNSKQILQENRQKIDLLVQYEVEKAGKIFSGNFIDFVPFELHPVIELKFIIKNIQQISFTFYSIYQQIYKISMIVKLPAQQKIPLQKTYKFCQKTVFQISKALIPKQMPQQMLQSILKIAEKFINLSGTFNDNATSTMYIKLICKYCLPNEFKNIGYRHVQINKMILNIANCLGNLFSTSSWAIIWKALQNYSIYYNRYLMGKQSLQIQRESDVQILYKSMDSIFTETPKYDDQYILKILQSLIEVTYECLQNNYQDESKKIFAFQRIEQIYKLNLFRIAVIWPELSSSLLCITTSKVLYFRLSALSLLNTLIPISLHHLRMHPENLIKDMTQDNFQNLILQPWINLSGCQFQQIKNQLAIAVNKIIIDYGHIMSKGWTCILQIIKKIKDIKSLQAIVQTYLDKITDIIMETILIIDQIQRSLGDMNQKYLCLTLIWTIGDACHKQENTKALRKIYQILLKPDQMFIVGMEARHSSFYIFAQIIVHNCSEKQQSFWEWIFIEIKNFYTYSLTKCMQIKDTNNCQEQIKNILINLIKIYRRLFSVSKQFKKNDLILKQLANFYDLCSKILQFRQSQVYQLIVKQLKDLFIMKTEESLQLNQFWNFLQSLTQAYFVQNQTKILKCLITYLPNDIYDILSRCLNKILSKFNIIYKLVQKIFLIRLQAQEKDIKLTQLRIFFQEKNFFQFWKKMHQEIMKIQSVSENKNQNQIIKFYLQNLIKTYHKLLLYQDFCFLQKMMTYLSSLVIKFAQKIDQNDTLQLFKKIINLKFDTNWITKNQKSKEVPVWYIATQDIIKLGYQFGNIKLEAPYKKIYQILFKLICKQNLDSSSDKIIQNSKIQNLYSKECLTMYYQNSNQILNFITECYVYNPYFQISDEQIEEICQIIRADSLYNENDFTNKGKNNYQLLFKLSQSREFQENQKIEPEEIKKTQSIIKYRQAIFVKVLFQRILETFDTFFKTEIPKNTELIKKQSSGPLGSFSYDKNQGQIKFCLKKMLNLNLQHKIMQESKMSSFLQKDYVQNLNPNCKVLQGQSAHLYYFYYNFSRCIKCQNSQIRQLVAQIIQKTGAQLLSMKD